MLPGLGGLECEIDSFSDMIDPKRASPSIGIIEAMIVTKINDTLRKAYSTMVTRLSD